MIGQDVDYDACGGVGRVTGLNPRGDNFLAVRGGPGTKYAMIDRLYTNDLVYVCDGHSGWLGIIYPGDGRTDCGVGSPVPRRMPYRGPCYSGWVFERYIEIVAG